MLESSSLLLAAPLGEKLAAAESRRYTKESLNILDPSTGTSLGLVRRSPGGFSFLGRFARKRLVVLENPDQSLLFTLRRAWSWTPKWLARDAIGLHLGTVAKVRIGWTRFGFLSDKLRGTSRFEGTVVLDSSGQCLAFLCGSKDGTSHSFLAPAGAELGSITPREKGALLTFAAEPALDPFARMLLLGAALVVTYGDSE